MRISEHRLEPGGERDGPAEDDRTMRTRTAVSAVIVGLVLLVVAAAAGYTAALDRSTVAASSALAAAPPADRLSGSIEAAERRLTEVPGDHATWAALGAMYVE